MNYLAHLSLSFDDAHLMLGNFVADEIRPSQIKHLPEGAQLGVFLHREIDRFTDAHPSFWETRQRLRSTHPKYAAVIIDIANDHFLSCSWSDFHSSTLEDFCDGVYAAFSEVEDQLEGKVLRHVSALVEHRYLHVYGSRVGLRGVMSRMDRRTSFPSDFASSVDDIWSDYDFYKNHFIQLYSDLQSELPTLMEAAQLTFEMKRDSKDSAQ